MSNYRFNTVNNIGQVFPRDAEVGLDDLHNTYGDIPQDILAAKFEETNIDDEDVVDAYHMYARGVAVDRRPDPILFPSDESRGPANARAAVLQLHYNGTRGDAEPPRHPEIFLGFGPEDRDPRGVAGEPNMALMARQTEARGRFTRFSKDDSAWITGGMRSETKVIADNMKVRDLTKSRMRVFSRQLDGRREGMNRVFKHKSAIDTQLTTASYGDSIKDYALNPQRKAAIISDQVIKDARMFGNDSADADFVFSHDGSADRKRVVYSKARSINDITQDTNFSDTSLTKNYKALGILMSQLVQAKRDAAIADSDFADVTATQARKAANAASDISVVLGAIQNDARWSESANTFVSKSLKPTDRGSAVNTFTSDHLLPAHMQLNVEIVRKSRLDPANGRAILASVVTDARIQLAPDAVKTFKQQSGVAAQTDRVNSHIDIEGESATTPNYRSKRGKFTTGGITMYNINAENYGSESAKTQFGATNHRTTTFHSTTDTNQDMMYGSNLSKERLGGRMGSKYTRRDMSRDGVDTINDSFN